MIDTDYAFETVEDYEEILGQKVNEAFKIGWTMARTTTKNIADLSERNEGGLG